VLSIRAIPGRDTWRFPADGSTVADLFRLFIKGFGIEVG